MYTLPLKPGFYWTRWLGDENDSIVYFDGSELWKHGFSFPISPSWFEFFEGPIKRLST